MSFFERRSVQVVLIASLAFRLLFVAHDMRDLVTHGPLYDDSFYAYEIARNMARGLGSTFDGVEPTNGYQPLYVFLLVPLYWIFSGHENLPIYVSLFFSALVNVLTGAILYRLARRYASSAAAIFALILWGFGPAVVRQSINGLETALAMFLLAAALEYYVGAFRSAAAGRRQAVTLGVLLGLAVLARIDAILFAAALALDLVWRRPRGALRRSLVVAATAAAMVLPWAITSQVVVGSVVPESGAATRFLSTAYAPHDNPAFSGMSFEDGPPAPFLAHNLSRSVLQLGTSPVMHVLTRGLERLLHGLRLDGGTTLYVLGSLVALSALLGGSIVFRRRILRQDANQRDFGFLFGYAVLLLAAYSFVVFGQIFYSRYYYPIFFFSILLGAFAFDVVRGLCPGPRLRRAVTLGVLLTYGLTLPYMSAHRLRNGNYLFRNVVDWIASTTPPGATIGVFNSGAIGYFSDRHIVNLDGKVNPAALAALRAGTLRDYLARRGVDYVVDHEWILGRFLLETEADDGGPHLVRVGDSAALGVPGWAAFRVEPRAVASERGAAGVATRLQR